MTHRRPKIPKKVEGSVLFENDHTCCICNQYDKEVQIHHIDGDESNNDPGNLAIVCLDCHSKVTGGGGFGKRYSPFEVEKYKRNWEYIIRKKRRLIFEPYRKLGKAELSLARFEIKKQLCVLAVTENLKRAKETLELLDMYRIFDGDSRFIMDTLRELAPFVSGSKSSMVADYVIRHFWHLPGPKHAKIKQKDVQALDKAIDVLAMMGTYDALSGELAASIEATLESLCSIFETASSYRLWKLQNKVVQSIDTIKEAILRSSASKKQKRLESARADFYLKKINRESSRCDPEKHAL